MPSGQWRGAHSFRSRVLRSGPSALGEARRACVPADAQSTLVAGCEDGSKQEAAKGIISWLAGQHIDIAPGKVWHFDDRGDNIRPFTGTGMNARQISCATRDPKLSVGLCGATNKVGIDLVAL